MGLKIVPITLSNTVYKRKPRAGDRFQLGVINEAGEVKILESMYEQRFNERNFNQLQKYVSKNSSKDTFAVFENKKTGYWEAPDRRKTQLGLEIKNGEFSKTLTRGYVKLSPFEKVNIEKDLRAKKLTSDRIESEYIYFDVPNLLEETMQGLLNETLPAENILDSKFMLKAEIRAFESISQEEIQIDAGVTFESMVNSIPELATRLVRELAKYGYKITAPRLLNKFRYDKKRKTTKVDPETGKIEIVEKLESTKVDNMQVSLNSKGMELLESTDATRTGLFQLGAGEVKFTSTKLN